ncbi:hypothetical protein HPB50_002290 [Hyalomma asiaticum]|uniref:Uncharacterized protein n=1 Tax=Hyalomma asiaticum TaxID=266040 RepID=A0ACB7SJQ2_HYAAI|nr:hypothetical protein HPB50_002290 [Hyalomma asiaticum]
MLERRFQSEEARLPHMPDRAFQSPPACGSPRAPSNEPSINSASIHTPQGTLLLAILFLQAVHQGPENLVANVVFRGYRYSA